MTDFKAMMWILGGVFALMCVIFYGFLFHIYLDAAPAFMRVMPLKS